MGDGVKRKKAGKWSAESLYFQERGWGGGKPVGEARRRQSVCKVYRLYRL